MLASVSVPDDLLIKLETSVLQFNQALFFSKHKNIPRGDVIHFILARDSGATLITRDNHFEIFIDLIEIHKPEELI